MCGCGVRRFPFYVKEAWHLPGLLDLWDSSARHRPGFPQDGRDQWTVLRRSTLLGRLSRGGNEGLPTGFANLVVLA